MPYTPTFEGDGEGVCPITSRGFLGLDWTGEGVVGLELGLWVRELGLGLGLVWDLGICFLESVGEGDGEGVVVLEKKAVIWRCGFTIGDLPLLGLRDGAIFSIFILFFAASRETETEHRERAK